MKKASSPLKGLETIARAAETFYKMNGGTNIFAKDSDDKLDIPIRLLPDFGAWNIYPDELPKRVYSTMQFLRDITDHGGKKLSAIGQRVSEKDPTYLPFVAKFRAEYAKMSSSSSVAMLGAAAEPTQVDAFFTDYGN